MAAVVDVSFLSLSNQRTTAGSAPDDSAVCGNVGLRPVHALARKHLLHFLEQVRGHDRLMHAFECLSGFHDPHQTNVEGILENRREAIYRHGSIVVIAEPK